jgi:hypothetical protein
MLNSREFDSGKSSWQGGETLSYPQGCSTLSTEGPLEECVDPAESGVVVFDKTLMDTQKSVLHFDGEAVLKTQELRSKITADTKQFDLLDLHSRC